MPVAYLNGQYLPQSEARISPMDRGFLFADGVYEVVPVYAGRPFRLAPHLRRLERGLAALDIDCSGIDHDWAGLLGQLVERNAGGDLSLYLQVTRGAPELRNHLFPPASVKPTVFATASALPPLPAEVREAGVAALTVADQRWQRCDLKTVALLGNVLARQQAHAAGAAEALLHRDGWLTEGSSSNVFVVHDATLLTPPADHRILPGITRELVLELAATAGVAVRETPIEMTSLAEAEEVWITSSGREITPVTRIDGRPLGAGVPGPVWQRLYAAFEAAKQCPA